MTIPLTSSIVISGLSISGYSCWYCLMLSVDRAVFFALLLLPLPLTGVLYIALLLAIVVSVVLLREVLEYEKPWDSRDGSVSECFGSFKAAERCRISSGYEEG